MVEKQIAAAQVVRKGLFDLKEFYFHIYTYPQWIKENGKEIEFHWTFIKEQEAYVHFRIWIECKVRGAREVKTKVGDLIKKLYDAELEFNTKAVIITDPNNKWGGHFLLKHFKKLYEDFIYKSQIEDYTTRLWEHIYDLEGEVKAFFELPRFG
jgi:hypothetical protein